MYQQHVRNTVTGETGVCVQRPMDDCPTIMVATDRNPKVTESWPKTDCVVDNPKPTTSQSVVDNPEPTTQQS